jgi:hypothetical protein
MIFTQMILIPWYLTISSKKGLKEHDILLRYNKIDIKRVSQNDVMSFGYIYIKYAKF